MSAADRFCGAVFPEPGGAWPGRQKHGGQMATAGQQQAASEDPVIRQLADDSIYLGITALTQLAQAECGAFYRQPQQP